MKSGFTARLGPRQSMLLQMAVMFVVVGSLFALGEAMQRADSLLTWCQNFVVAGSARVAALAVGVSVTLLLVAVASVGSVLLFAVGETVSALKFAAAVRRKTVPSPGRVLAVVTRARIRAPVTTVEDAKAFAVTVGLFSPRIIVSTALVSALTAIELSAVLAHEDAHSRELHPLRALGWETLRRTFFFIPILADVTDHFALVREIAADKHAVAERGSRALASAMLKAVTGYVPAMPAAAAPFGHIHSRIAALSGESGTEFRLSATRSFATVTAAALLALTYLLLGSAEAMAGEVGGGKCEVARSGDVTEYVFSPYFAVVVPQMSHAPADNNMSTVPVQSSSVRP